jgi:hypothetical protein
VARFFGSMRRCSEMTKDLAILVHGTPTPDQYLNTIPFIDAVATKLQAKLAQP